MLCSDTGCQQAVRIEHLDKKTARKINKYLGMFKQFSNGSGRLTLIVNSGNVAGFELLTKDTNKDEPA